MLGCDFLFTAKDSELAVVVDPNPTVALKGIDKLRAAGVEVIVGVEWELYRNLDVAYIHHMLAGKPFVTLRCSISLNGLVINQLGEGADKSGRYYSKLLQEYEAVVISSTLLGEKLSGPTSQGPGADEERVREPNPAIDGIETVVSDQISMHEIFEYCQRQRFCSFLVNLRSHTDDIEELLKDAIERDALQKVLVEALPFWDGSDINGSTHFISLKRILKGLTAKCLMPKVAGQCAILEGYFQQQATGDPLELCSV